MHVGTSIALPLPTKAEADAKGYVQAIPEPQARHLIRRRLGAVVRLATRVVLLLGLALAGLAVYLALPPGKAFVLRTVSASLVDHLGIEARAGRLDYRPGSLGITLHALSLRHVTAARPFFSAERVEIDVSPAMLRGSLVLRRLDVSSPDVVLDATTQPPSASAADRDGKSYARSTPNLSSLVLHGGSVRDLALTSVGADGTRLAVQGLSLSFTGEGPGRVRGTVTVAGGWSVRRGSAEVSFDRARADVALAGASLALTSIRMESPVAAIEGTASVDAGRGDLDVKYHARVAAGELRTWLPELPPLEGVLEVSGTVTGTLEHPVATFDGRAERLRWREFTDIRAAVIGRWSGTDLTIERYDASSRALGADLRGSARLVVGGRQGLSSVRAEASVASVRVLARLKGRSAPPDAAVRLTGDLAWPGSRPAADALSGRVQMALLDPAAPRPIATADATGDAGRWRVRTIGALQGDTSMAADVSVVLDQTNLTQSTIAGRLGVRSENLEEAVRELRRQAVLPPTVEAVLQGGRAAAEATLSGTLAAPRLEARLTASSLTLAGVEQVRGEAQVRLAGGAIDITRMTAEASGNRVDVHGTAAASHGPVHLTIDALINRPDLLAAALPAEWRPTGSLAVSATLDGSPAEPRLIARVSGRDLGANGIVVDSLEGDVAFAQGILQVTGLLDGPALGPLELTATSAGQAVRFDVRLPALSADLSGGIGLGPGRPFDARANFHRSTLASLAALTGRTIALPDTSAAISATAEITGQLDRPLASTAVITVPELAGEFRGLPFRLSQPGRVRFDGPRLSVEQPLRTTVGGVTLALDRIPEREHGSLLTLEGRIEDGLALLPPDTPITPWDAKGSLRAQVSLDQDADRFVISGDADATLDRLLRGEGEIARALRLQARIQEGAIAFSATGGDVLGAPFGATGRVPLAWALPGWLANRTATGRTCRRTRRWCRRAPMPGSRRRSRPSASGTRSCRGRRASRSKAARPRRGSTMSWPR